MGWMGDKAVGGEMVSEMTPAPNPAHSYPMFIFRKLSFFSIFAHITAISYIEHSCSLQNNLATFILVLLPILDPTPKLK